MEIFVCIKQVPDTTSSILLNEAKTDIIRDGLSYIINPYDEYAIEEALKIKDAAKDTIVTLVSVTAKDVSVTLRTGLAMGADRAIQILDQGIANADSLLIAKILAAIIGRSKFDLVLTGKQAVDDDCAAVGPMVAQILNIPVATFAVKFELSADRAYATVHREVEAALEIVKLKLPSLVTAQKGLNTPRLPTLSGIMQAKKKQIEVLTLSDIGISLLELSGAGKKMERAGLCLPQERTQGVILQGELSDIAKEIVRLLKEKDKVL